METVWIDWSVMDDITSKIKNHTDDLEEIYKQRRLWLYASSVVVVAVIGIIVSWFYLSSFNNNLIWWGIISISLIVSINWWYWTISSIGKLVRAIHTEYAILNEISLDLANVRIIINCKETSDKNCKECPAVDSCTEMKK
jgi:uncharacterized membrane protein